MNLLLDYVGLVKKAAVEAVEAAKPATFVFGQVISADPLKIQVDQKTIHEADELILTRNVTDFEMDATVSMQDVVISHGHPVTDTYTGGGTAQNVNHNHTIRGRKKLKIHNALVVGDWVMLARVPGGEKFIVLDRIKPIPELKGEWL